MMRRLSDLIRAVSVPSPGLKSVSVWDGTGFSFAVFQLAPSLGENVRYCGVETFCGFPVRVDRSLPDGVMEVRSSTDGRLLARVVNIGREPGLEMG